MSRLLQVAVDGKDWVGATAIIERHWSRFILDDTTVLDRALRALPRAELLAHPVVVAVREIRLRMLGDVDEPDLRPFESHLPHDASRLEHFARSGSGRLALSATTAFMVAYRLHGHFSRALRFADLAEEAARFALRHDPGDTVARVPSVHVQIGITRLQGDDPLGAHLSLKEAYDTRAHGDDPFIGHDASGKLALLLALQGESRSARAWLERYRESDLLEDPVLGVALPADLAAALLAIEGTESKDLPVLADDRKRTAGWGDALALVSALSALHRDDPYHAQKILEIEERRAQRSPSNPFFRSRLIAAHGDVLTVLGHGTLAYQKLRNAAPSSPTKSSLARLHLLAGDNAKALDIAEYVINSTSSDTRNRLDALATASLAAQRLGREEQAQATLRQALVAFVRSGMSSAFALHPRTEILGLLTETPPRAGKEEVIASLRAAPLVPPPSITIVHLTAAERRVLMLLAERKSRSQIAALLFLSPNTVKTQLRSLYTKLGADTRVTAVRHARWLGFLPALDHQEGEEQQRV